MSRLASSFVTTTLKNGNIRAYNLRNIIAVTIQDSNKVRIDFNIPNSGNLGFFVAGTGIIWGESPIQHEVVIFENPNDAKSFFNKITNNELT